MNDEIIELLQSVLAMIDDKRQQSAHNYVSAAIQILTDEQKPDQKAEV